MPRVVPCWPCSNSVSMQGFDNLNALLQLEDSRASAYSASGLAALVVVKIVATAVCRGSGLVGGVYAPSLFMGAKLIQVLLMRFTEPVPHSYAPE